MASRSPGPAPLSPDVRWFPTLLGNAPSPLNLNKVCSGGRAPRLLWPLAVKGGTPGVLPRTPWLFKDKVVMGTAWPPRPPAAPRQPNRKPASGTRHGARTEPHRGQGTSQGGPPRVAPAFPAAPPTPPAAPSRSQAPETQPTRASVLRRPSPGPLSSSVGFSCFTLFVFLVLFSISSPGTPVQSQLPLPYQETRSPRGENLADG
uniref:Uncharacterized protein n=1 Tax=Pipistrellus kuhlii TaxID=59472 RepID=A0A7J7TPL9_PIPKU|nr:hypothetical protein mPipKuh1_009329 [Pipistrellus kuhlii]